MNSLSINVFYALKCSVQQLMSSQVCAFHRSILSEKTVCLPACVWSRISCLLWSWETDLYLDLLKAFDKKRAVNMIVKFRLHSLAWEWIGSMGRHWHPRMHNQTPCWCYAVYSVHLQKTQKKRWVKYLIFQTSFLWDFIWENQWRCAWKCGSIIFFAGTNGQKRSLRPTFAPPKTGVFLASRRMLGLAPLRWLASLNFEEVFWQFLDPENPTFLGGEKEDFLCQNVGVFYTLLCS